MDWLERISPCLRPVLGGETQISHTWHADTPSGWLEPMRVIYDHELVLFSKGCYIVEVEGVRYDCPEHTYIIVPCGRLHSSWSVEGRGHRYWTHFDWVWQGKHENTPLMTYHPAKPRSEYYHPAPEFVPEGVMHGHIERPERVYDLAERLCALQHRSGSRGRLLGKALLMEILMELLDIGGSTEIDWSWHSGPAQRVRELLERTDATNRVFPPIQELLDRLGFSYAHLCREFKATYGIPPLKYVHALRIGRAKLLLGDTDLGISEVAYRIGFDDANYFTQLFRRMTGISPSEFRRRGGRSLSSGLPNTNVRCRLTPP